MPMKTSLLTFILTLMSALVFGQTLEPQYSYWPIAQLVPDNTLTHSVNHDYDNIQCGEKQLTNLRVIVHFDHGDQDDQGKA